MRHYVMRSLAVVFLLIVSRDSVTSSVLRHLSDSDWLNHVSVGQSVADTRVHNVSFTSPGSSSLTSSQLTGCIDSCLVIFMNISCNIKLEYCDIDHHYFTSLINDVFTDDELQINIITNRPLISDNKNVLLTWPYECKLHKEKISVIYCKEHVDQLMSRIFNKIDNINWNINYHIEQSRDLSSQPLRVRRQAESVTSENNEDNTKQDDNEDYDYDTYDQNYNDIFSIYTTTETPPVSSKTVNDDNVNEEKSKGNDSKIVEKSISENGGQFAPYLRQSPGQLVAKCGRLLTWQVPVSTFVDMEQGDTRHLSLSLLFDNGDPIDTRHWLQFNTTSQTVYALPLQEHVGSHQYKLRATDADNHSTSVLITVEVDNFIEWSSVTHTLYLTLIPADDKLTVKTLNQQPEIDWQVNLIHHLTSLTYRVNVGAALAVHSVLSVAGISQRQIQMTFGSIESDSRCPRDKLSQLRQLLFTKHGEPSPALYTALSSLPLKLSSAQLKLSGVCSGVQLPHLEHVLPAPTSSTSVPYAFPGVYPVSVIDNNNNAAASGNNNQFSLSNMPPVVRQPIDTITSFVGQLIDVEVNDNVFTDNEDGGVWNMKSVILLNSVKVPVQSSNWLQLDTDRHTLSALPRYQHIGTHLYYLQCEDSGGLREDVQFKIIIKPQSSVNNTAKHTTPVLLFDMTVSESLNKWQSRGGVKHSALVRSLASLGGGAVSHLMFYNITGDSSQLIIRWYNTSLTADSCPVEAVSKQRSVYNTQSVRDQLSPLFSVISVNSVISGVCTDNPTLLEQQVNTTTDTAVILYIIPAVVVTLLLLVALVVAWRLLRHRQTRGKMSVVQPANSGDHTVSDDCSAEEMTELAPAINGGTADSAHTNGTTAETPMLSGPDNTVNV